MQAPHVPLFSKGERTLLDRNTGRRGWLYRNPSIILVLGLNRERTREEQQGQNKPCRLNNKKGVTRYLSFVIPILPRLSVASDIELQSADSEALSKAYGFRNADR
jgi:hypothetical protein